MQIGVVGADCVRAGSFSTPTHIWITPAQETIRQAPFLPFLPRPALQSLFCRRGSHGGVFHATTHFSQLLPLPGAPAFQDADLGVGCRVVGVTMFISHSGGSAPFPSFLSHSRLLNPSRLGLPRTTATGNETDKLSALLELMF